MARFPDPFLRAIEKHFRAQVIRLTNPLDLGDLFDFEVYTRIVEETLKLPEVDGVVFLHTYISSLEGKASRALLSKIEELSFQYGKPAVTCVATDQEEMSALRKNLPHPVYTEPEDAIRSLALARDFDHQARPAPRLPDGELDRAAIEAVLSSCRRDGRQALLHESLEILKAAGLVVPEWSLVSTAEEAEEAAKRLDSKGFGVAMKLVAAEASHKTDVGGVELGLVGAVRVRKAFESMTAAAKELGLPGPVQVLLQPMVEGGMEMILGARRDDTFGPAVLVGLGGIFVEVFKDTALCLVPFDEGESAAMLKRLRAYPLLAGVRGQNPRDIEALRHGLEALGRLMAAFPEIQELDVNPILVGRQGEGAQVVDARIFLGLDEPSVS